MVVKQESSQAELLRAQVLGLNNLQRYQQSRKVLAQLKSLAVVNRVPAELEAIEKEDQVLAKKQVTTGKKKATSSLQSAEFSPLQLKVPDGRTE